MIERLKLVGDNIGFLFHNKIFNGTSSGGGVGFTSANCARSFFKDVASPMPCCRFYFTGEEKKDCSKK